MPYLESMLKKPVLIKSRKQGFLEDLERYLVLSSKWVSKSAMVGTFTEDLQSIRVERLRGQQSFIEVRYEENGSAIFTLLEAIALFSAGKLIIISGNPARALSGHEFYSICFKKHTFSAVSCRMIFSRLSISAYRRSVIQKERSTIEEKTAKGTFYAIMSLNRHKVKTSSEQRLLNPTSIVKVPEGHGLPDLVAVCLDSDHRVDSKGLDVVAPILNRFSIQLKPLPSLNFVSLF